MRDHSGYVEKTRHEATQDVLDAWEFERRVEHVDVTDALGRVAASNVLSLNTLPNKLTSNMDGIAVYFSAFEEAAAEAGISLEDGGQGGRGGQGGPGRPGGGGREVAPDGAGAPDTSTWVRGRDWQFCNTGIGMPGDFDTAIPIEWVEVSDDDEHVTLNRLPERRGQSTTPVGATLQEGDLLVKAGEVLTPALLAALNQGGHTQVDVVTRPVVAFIPTGNELVDAGKPLDPGKNVESNAVMICAKLVQWGAEPLRYDIVPDNWEKLEATLKDAAEKADVVVINAGSSKGSDDFTCEILEKNGRMLHHMLAQGPGRHCSAAILDGTPVIGISGPPMGAEFTTDWMVKPLVDRYLGLSGAYPPMVFARMVEAPAFWPDAVQVVKRGYVWRDDNDELWACVVEPGMRPILRELDEANCFITFGRGVDYWNEGDWHAVELRWPYTVA